VRLEYGTRMILGVVRDSLLDYATRLVELGIGFEDDGSEFWGISFEA
jgi:hypothetical protein